MTKRIRPLIYITST